MSKGDGSGALSKHEYLEVSFCPYMEPDNVNSACLVTLALCNTRAQDCMPMVQEILYAGNREYRTVRDFLVRMWLNFIVV